MDFEPSSLKSNSILGCGKELFQGPLQVARHVIDTHCKPFFLESNATYNVASDVCQARRGGRGILLRLHQNKAGHSRWGLPDVARHVIECH